MPHRLPERLPRVTANDPLRVLSSACLLGHHVGWEGGPYTADVALALAACDRVRITPFCPEDRILGTPRLLTTLHGGNGFDVLDGTARVRDTAGNDHTEDFLGAAQHMLALAQAQRIELAILMEISDSCGSTAVYLGAPDNKEYQQGPGVCAALLMRHHIPVVGSRDYRTLRSLLQQLGSDRLPPLDEGNFCETPWYQEYFDRSETPDEATPD